MAGRPGCRAGAEISLEPRVTEKLTAPLKWGRETHPSLFGDVTKGADNPSQISQRYPPAPVATPLRPPRFVFLHFQNT